MSKKLRWVPLSRKYDHEDLEQERRFPHSRARQHPLVFNAQPDEEDVLDVPANAEDPLTSFSEDPLSSFSGDPLSSPALSFQQPFSKKFVSAPLEGEASMQVTEKTEKILDWEVFRKEILTTYTTQTNIPIVSKVLDDVEKEQEVITLTERAKRRLEGLGDDDDEGTSNVRSLSQKELVNHLESLAEELETSWGKGEKVKSLRIVIQATKMLINCKVPAIYPSLFVLVAKVLDTFGRLVYERIKRRAQFDERTGVPLQTLPQLFTCADIPDEAKEMCKNWFFKIASIRELAPRLYVEMCLWKCNHFLSDSPDLYDECMQRFVEQARGIGDPLVANYARCYLLKKASEVFIGSVPQRSAVTCFDDFLNTRQQWKGSLFAQYLETHGLSLPQYIHLYTPSLRWMLSTIGPQADEAGFTELLGKYSDCGMVGVLQPLLASCRPEYISNNVMHLIQLIQSANTEEVVSRTDCYAALGTQLIKSPPSEKTCMRVLNDVWGDVSDISNPTEYMPIAQVWLEFVVKHFREREIGILLEDIMSHLGKSQFSSDLESNVEGVLTILLLNVKDFQVLFSMQHVLPLIDLLKPSNKVEICKKIMSAFSSRGTPTHDPIVVNSLLDISRTLHDSLNDLSIEHERRHFEQLIVCFMGKMEFDRDLDGHLQFLVECRRSFSRMDAIVEACVISAIRLVDKATRITVIKQHSKKNAAFVKACLAFCHISIPSLQEHFQRLKLFLLAAMVSLCAGFIAQCDILIRTCINTLQDVPPVISLPNKTLVTTQDQMIEFIAVLCSSMVVIPGHPEHGPFYLFTALSELVTEYAWENVAAGRSRCRLLLLQAMSTLAQDRLPYHFSSGTPSNDELYAGNKDFKAEIEEMCTTTVDAILLDVAELDEKQDTVGNKLSSSICLDLVNVIVSFSEPSEKMQQLASKVYSVSSKTRVVGLEAYSANTLKHISLLADWRELSEKLK